MTEGALKVAIHRLRQKFRSAVRAEVAHTVGDHSTVAEEMECLVRALS